MVGQRKKVLNSRRSGMAKTVTFKIVHTFCYKKTAYKNHQA